MYLIRIIAVITLLSVIALMPAEAMTWKRVAILQYSDDPRYAQAVKGFIDQLNKEGFREPAITFLTENARGSRAKAAELSANIASGKPDLIFAMGTLGAVPVARVIKDLPVVFSIVYDPIESGIAEGWKSSGNNTTGSSTMISMSDIVKTVRSLRPVKRLAVLYTPGEKNSELQLLELQKIQASQGIKVIPVILTGKEEVARIMPEVVRTAEAIYVTGSTVVGGALQLIVATANKANIITVTHLDDLVQKGVLLGVCADPYRLGLLAGKKAAMILRGARPSAIPIETDRKPDVIINRASVKAGKFIMPASFMKKVTKFVE